MMRGPANVGVLAVVLVVFSALSFAPSAHAAIENPRAKVAKSKVSASAALAPVAQKPRWMLNSFLTLSAHNPNRLIRIARKLFSDERLRMTSLEPNLAYEWQHRLAMVSALSDVFDPGHEKKRGAGNSKRAMYKMQAREILRKALIHDPSLLVRDGAAESIRRVMRMQTGERSLWRAPLENAFLNSKNSLGGEGFFIRETLLTAMKENALQPSARVRQAALRDKNAQVRQILREFNSQAYDEI